VTQQGQRIWDNSSPSSRDNTKRASFINKAKWLIGASVLAASTSAIAAPPLVLKNITAAPTVQGTGQGKRAVWVNAGTVGGLDVDIVATITTATLNHTLNTAQNGPSILSVGQDNIQIEWRIFTTGSGYNITTNTGGTLLAADVHVQFDDIDGTGDPATTNEKVFVPVCSGAVKWVRIAETSVASREFGTVAGQPETFTLVGRVNYPPAAGFNPASGLEVFYPDSSTFRMGRTANNAFLIVLKNPTYSPAITLDFECADFKPPVAVDDSKEGVPGSPTVLNILNNDSTASLNNNAPNNNTLAASEFGRSSVSLVAPPGATGIVTQANGDVIGFTVPGEGTWSYNDTTGALTFTPDPSFTGFATSIKYTVDNALGVASNQANVTVWYPGIGVTKSSTFNDTNGDTYGQVGETIDYIYQVKSYGAEALQNVSVAETGFTGAGTAPVPVYDSGDTNTDTKLDLTETWTFKATYTLVAADLTAGSVTNSATGTGQTAAGTVVTDTSDSNNPADGNGTGTSAPGPNNDDPTKTPLASAPIAATNNAQTGTIFSNNGVTNAYDVLGNDTLKGIAPTPATVTLTVETPASNAGVTLDTATGLVSVAAGTPAGTYSIDYKICETGNPGNCATATASIVVTAPTQIAAATDAPAPVKVATGGTNIINALTNDVLNNAPVVIGDVNLTVTTPASNAGVTLDPATGLVSVAPGTPSGSYTINYQICEKANPTNCANSTVTVVVEATPITATNDSVPAVNGAAGNPNAFNAFANDTLNNAPVVATDINTTVTAPATPKAPGAPVPILDPATGNVAVPAGTPAGSYTIGYQICEKADPGNCKTATITVVVSAAPIAADNDSTAPVNSANGGSNLVNALTNDTLNNAPAVIANIDLTVVTPATNAGVTLDPATGLVSVAPGTPAGNYTIAYRICEKLNSANCALANITVPVTLTPIAATNDAPAPVAGISGGNDIINAFANDRLNGAPVVISDINATITTPATPKTPGAPVPVLDPATGLVDVPANTPAGTYTIDYQICEKANPANCAPASVTVVVTAAPIAANNDNAGTVTTAAGGANLINALTNDRLNGVAVVPANINLTVTTPATNPGVTLDPVTGQVSVAPGTPAGNYTIGYQICEKLNPANCATATVAVVVEATPLGAVNDSPAPVNSINGNPSAINAFANDTLNGAPVVPSAINTTILTPASNPGVVMDPVTGNVSVAPGTPAGTYTIIYEICEKANPGNCKTATVTVVVEAAPIAAITDAPAPVVGATGGNDIINALANDTLNNAPVVISAIDVTVTTPATPKVPGASVPVLDPATGLVDVPAGTPQGTYTIGYKICEKLNPANCADTIVTVVVTAAPIAATPDTPPAVNGATGNPSVTNAFTNDTLNGLPVVPSAITATITTPATNPGVVLDPVTGNVSVSPGTPAGTYTITYQICENLNPTNCATSTVTVIVDPAPIAATPDTPPAVNGATGNPSVTNAFTNDTLNGVPVAPSAITATITTPATNPGVVLDPVTGNVSVAPGTPAGTYTITYQICEKLNPANCATSTVTVIVDPAPIAATNDDAGSVPGIAGGPNLVNALVNDSLNGQPVNINQVNLTVTSPASNPGVTLDPATGLVSVAPNTPSGTYSIGYQICEILNPANCATATVAVMVQAAAITAAPDAPAPVNGANGANDVINAFTNDLLNGVPVVPANITATITAPATPATPGALVPAMDPVTGLVDVPAGTPAGTYTIGYQICENLNPANCTNSVVTVVVQPPAIVASVDTPAPVRQGVGNPAAINAFTNDTLNGVAVTPALITATVLTPAANPGVVLDPATGNVSVGADVPAGTYTIQYQICETLNPANCAISTVTVVVEPPVSAVTGTVFTDTDGDGVIDPNEPRRAGWIVEIVRDGVVVGTAVTDANGDYRVEGLTSGPGYDIVFRNPENNVVYDIIDDVTLGANTTVVDQNQPIDPSGVFFDSITRLPISGVTVQLTDPSGTPLPAVCFVDASQARQTTGASGEYRFDIVPGAAPQCPVGETLYRIAVTPPAGYAPGSTVLLPQPGPFDPTGLPAPVRINPDPTPPTAANPPFFLDFRLAAGDPDIINNHIALDPFLNRTPLIVTKTSIKRTASVGEIVPYEITVRNTENFQRTDVSVVDILPPGMKYVMGTASVNGVPQEPVKTDRQLSWSGQIIPANGSSRYNLTLVVGAGVTGGEKVNTGVALNGPDGAAISNRGTAVVSITPNAVFDCSELIGKVFEDANRNGYQDEGEPGVPGVRLATVNGQLITTDEFGRYHIACAAVPDARIGSNFVLKVDTRTLPLGWGVTTDNPRSIRLTRGKFGELNFGVAPQDEETIPRKDTSANRNEKGE
jgi:large repetitive protein